MWGCDGPSPGPVFAIDCPRCFGSDQDCHQCRGTGLEEIDRCPNAILDPGARRMCDYVSLVETGILPVDGGWERQSAAFASMLSLLNGARARHEERLRMVDEEAQVRASAAAAAQQQQTEDTDGSRDGTPDA